MNTKLIVVFTASAFILAGCSSAGEVSDKPTPDKSRLERVLDSCDVNGTLDYIRLGDSGASLVIDTQGEEDDSGASLEDTYCILQGTKITDADLNLVDETRALDGRQQGSWNGFDASWSYHPDSGLNITLIDSKS